MNKKRMSEIIILIEKLDGIKNDFENIQEEEEKESKKCRNKGKWMDY